MIAVGLGGCRKRSFFFTCDAVCYFSKIYVRMISTPKFAFGQESAPCAESAKAPPDSTHTP